jgi:succinate-semialdehyde dehydrogenase / glutarate-semialdehyde dehydrogenase
MSAMTVGVRNPRTGVADYYYEALPESAISARVAALRTEQAHWSHATIAERVNALTEWRDALLAARDAIVEALAIDTGRWIETQLEFEASLAGINRWLERAPRLILESHPRASVVPPMQLHPTSVPLGVVGVISPWNFPLLLALIDTVPALLAGCAVMLKPSEVTPRFVAPLCEALRHAPQLAKVLDIVVGGPAIGRVMIDNVDAVCFTGSVATGRVVARHAAERLIPCYLELGGKDPAIVLAGANLKRAAKAIAWGGIVNAGQSCLSIERVLVDASIHDAFVAELTFEVARLTLNVEEIRVGAIGPIIAERQVTTLREQLADARSKGARVMVGGELVQSGGWWCQPTVLTQVRLDMQVMTDETFGPLLPVMPFADAAEAVMLANTTEFGLSAAVFGPSDAAKRVASELECGAISINDAALTAIVHDGEKQAFKSSGLGPTRMGDASIQRFRKAKVWIENPTENIDPWWFKA